MLFDLSTDDAIKQSFPDRYAVDIIRAALWRGPANTRACAMIGAGFSRNAEPVSSSARSFPGWADMAVALSEALYPSEEPQWREAALKDASATSGFLRLAQEYETAFGRLALNERIRSMVPDHDYQPGALHRRLLTLPWGDIFTTNWDTLLERAGRDVFSRNYDTVHTYAEIPGAQRPRIVHLHGSFPAYDPFVFTEEDFRRYPSTHAPFVNLVQQALMESTLCLIGFSGEDPNFLHWSGWVRDNLGPHSPKIFLVGWLNLPPHRRRMLESRNVVPVDLSLLPGAAAWPAGMRHRNALRWLLTELECPPIPNPLQWPWTGHSEGSTPNRPIQLADPRNAAPPEVEQIVSTLLATWRDERDCYPDWFIAPKRVRDAIWSATEPQLTFIDHIGKETLTEQIVDLYRETCWRLNVSLAPPTPFTQSCYKLLKNIGFFSDETDQSHGLFVIWNKVNERVDAAQHIALFVARAAIRDGNDQCFHQVTGAIRKHRYRTQDVNNELIYAQALWTRDHALFRDLEKCLEPWNVDLADHGWGIRKAGLLSYLGWTRSSQALGSATIRNIRQYRRRDIVDLAAFSREAWALWHLPRSDAPTTKCAGRARASSELQRVRNAESEDDETFDEWANDASARWRELAVYDCNPLAECAELLANLFAVRVSHAADPTANEPHDSGNSSVSRSLRHIRRVNEMLRLADEISLGCVNGQSRRFQLALRASIVESASSTPYMSSIYAIRLATEADDPMLKQVFSHTRVSKLDPANRELLETILKTERDFLKGHEASRFFNHLERNRRGAVVEHVLKALAAPAEVVSTAVEQPVPPPE